MTPVTWLMSLSSAKALASQQVTKYGPMNLVLWISSTNFTKKCFTCTYKLFHFTSYTGSAIENTDYTGESEPIVIEAYEDGAICDHRSDLAVSCSGGRSFLVFQISVFFCCYNDFIHL